MIARDELVTSYNKLNSSYKKKLIFHVGVEAGFFSEYNNMILAMLYCLDNKIQFILYSKDANFGIQKGWADIFDPFCNEVYDDFHTMYNLRFPVKHLLWKTIFADTLKMVFRKQERTVIDRYKWKIKKEINKWIYDFNYYTFDLFLKYRNRKLESKHYYIPELGIDGDLQSACQILTHMTWKFNDNVQQRIDSICQNFDFTVPRIGMHIRGGDKFCEHELLNPHSFIQKASSLELNNNAFVLTDDYRIIETLKNAYPHWNISTLCTEEEKGYYTGDFHKEDKHVKFDRHIRLFASIECLCKCTIFLGTFSSNPSMFVGMRLNKERSIGMDLTTWQIW